MKRKLFVLVLVACSLLSCTDGIWNAIHDLEDKYSDLDGRVAKLEELCKEMNTNISSLQTLVSVILSNDYIISITPITKEGKEIGYTMTFAIHEPITIYHGQDGADGKDGENGKDGKDGKDGLNGQDGVTPIIGVAQDEVDHAYYWTLNGEWLLDVNGNRIPLTSRDGINGQDGQDGKDGKDGKDGVNGITPQLKIEGGYWFVSTDNGTTWTQLGKAVGENGQNGQDGKDGKDGTNGKDGKDGKDGEKGEKGDPGDTMFSEVTQDDEFVYFTLYNGTVLTVPKGNKEQKVQIVDGAIIAPFSVSATKQVYFSQGNLLYSQEGTHQCADGSTKSGTWRFAENQWEEGTLLYMGNSGYNYDVQLPTSKTEDATGARFAFYTTTTDISGTYYDWGKYNAIQNGGNVPSTFRTLTDEEWNYLLNERPNANKLKGTIKIDNIKGLYLLPDTWAHIGAILPSTVYSNEDQIYGQFVPFKDLEEKGVVFLFYDENYSSTSIMNHQNSYGTTYYTAGVLYQGAMKRLPIARMSGNYSVSGPDKYQYSIWVRLVKDVE